MKMTKNSKITLVAAVAALSFVSPALAQSFDADFGTGNELPAQYSSRGNLVEGTVARQSGLSAYAAAPASGSTSIDQTGGSVGYVEPFATH
jgi:hypothetical protein